MFVVVGDVVSSRQFQSMDELLSGLATSLEAVNKHVPGAALPLALVVRDEFHGVFADLRTAMEACLRLRLAIGDVVLETVEEEAQPADVRLGVGHGHADVTTAGTPSGSAWFHARDAKDRAQELAAKSKWPPSVRTICRSDDPSFEGVVNAYLLCQDQLLARMDHRDRRALRGLLDGERQIDVADDLGVSQPAIARRVKDRGALALHRALLALSDVRPPALASTLSPDTAHSPS